MNESRLNHYLQTLLLRPVCSFIDTIGNGELPAHLFRGHKYLRQTNNYNVKEGMKQSLLLPALGSQTFLGLHSCLGHC